MDWISLGWLRPDSGRDFSVGTGKKPIECKPVKTEGGSIFLADYHGQTDPADTIRRHPSEQESSETLREALSRHKLAIGYRTSALVIAALEGLEIDCRDERNIMSNPNWLELLPYADWHHTEIQAGDAWDHLWQSKEF